MLQNWRQGLAESTLLLVEVLLLVIGIAICSLLHDGEGTTLGRSANHLLLDPGRDGSGLLLLGLGSLDCCLLLGSNDTGCTDQANKTKRMSVSLSTSKSQHEHRAEGPMGMMNERKNLRPRLGPDLALAPDFGEAPALFGLAGLNPCAILTSSLCRFKKVGVRRWWSEERLLG